MSSSRSSATRSPRTRDGRSLPRTLALVIGALFLLIGILGFVVTGFDNFAEHTDETLLGFEVNPLHNVVHIVVGLAGLLMSSSLSTARAFGWLLAIAYGGTFVLGLVVDDDPDQNFLSLNAADNVLHLVSAGLGLVIALAPARERDHAEVAPHPGTGARR